MLSENHRISKLAKKRDPNAHPSSAKRLPVAKTTMQDYTEQLILRKIITIYKNKLHTQQPFPKPTPKFNQPNSNTRFKKPSQSTLTKSQNKTTIKSNQTTIQSNQTDQLTIIIGHGRFHPYYSYLPKPAILLDINPVARPDILGDMLNKKFMDRFPTNYFDQVILMYTPPPHSFHERNNQLWKNIHRLLKPKRGTIKSYYIHKVYSRKFPHLGKIKFQEELQKLIPQNLFTIKVQGSLVILIKN